jgi:hypothetical protein
LGVIEVGSGYVGMELLGLVKTEMVIRSERRMLLVFVLMLG